MTGPYGYLQETLPAQTRFRINGAYIESSTAFADNFLRKMIIGITSGFKRFLRIRGVGYHLKPVEGNTITLIAGFSYDLSCPLHPSIRSKATRKFSMIKVQSKYLCTTTNNLALLRRTQKADIYRGLGIYYRYEKILYKPGSKQKMK